MKLELDINSAQHSLPDNYSDNSVAPDSNTEEVKKTLRLGINLAKEGNRAEARQKLLKVTEAEPENETAWLWLASISEYPEELLIFLQNVLKVNPHNERALEWAKQTKTLLSKTFVQRGINASRDNQKDFAKQCFLQGIVHDDQNEMAWLWLASTSDSQEEKLSHLQKVLQINSQNETALSSLNAVKSQMSQSLLKKANSAAIAGDRETSRQILESIMKNTPNLEEAWILKAYLADEYYEKIDSYKKALEINPQNEAAQAGLASLQALAQKTTKPLPELPQTDTPTKEETVQTEAQTVSQTSKEDVQPEPTLFENSEPVVEQAETHTEMAATDVSEKMLPENIETVPQQVVAEEVQAETEEVTADENELTVQAEENVQIFSEEPQQVSPKVTANTLNTKVEADITESEDSPTQELDEEFARTADAVFNSYQQGDDDSDSQFEIEISEDEIKEEQVVEEDKVQDVQIETIETIESKTLLVTQSVAEIDEPITETTENTQNHETNEESALIYQSPYFSNNGFEMVSTNEPFADYQQPTVELSSSNFSNFSAPANEYFDQQNQEESVVEPFSPETAETFQPETEHPTNGFAHPQAELTQELPDVEQTVEETPGQVTEEVPAQLAPCPFCEFENEAQNVVCNSCQAILSLSDLEMLLAHQEANQDLLLAAIEKMEVEKNLRDLSVDELTSLGIAYLNARNLRKGFSCLQEASQLNPNDVVLGSKVNFLAIRLNEIEEHDHKALENPVQSRTILVVDDSPTVRKLISGKLEKSGHSVISAVDGMDALAKINEVIPDLILLDITMPRLDGYQVCKLIRNNDVTKDIPIVMISGKDGFFDKVRGRMAGSTGYITKPFGPDTLMKTIETYLG